MTTSINTHLHHLLTRERENIFISVLHQTLSRSIKSSKVTAAISNLSEAETTALHDLQHRTDIVIRPADKGSAIVIQDAVTYRDEALRQLSDAQFYRKLEKDPTQANAAKVASIVRSMESRNVINTKTAKDLVETKARTPHLYTLPKIHKRLDNPPGRPIVSSNQAPTERISCIVDQYLKSLVKQLPAYIKDTKDFLCHLRTLQDLPEDALLFTMDVVGLYTNIPHADGLKAFEAILNNREVQEPPTKEIVELATLVLTCNSFQFEDDHYLQIKVTAMGTRMAPSYAYLFMGQLEKTILMTAPENHVPGFYKRFLDDVFGIWLHGEQAFLEFIAHANSVNSDIKFSVSSSVVYLIQCSLCNCVYVGETGCKVRERMNQHRFDISRHNDTPVAAHFSLPGHNLQISVLQSTHDSVIMRRLIERTWISRIRSMPGYFVINRNDGISILQL